MFGRRQCDQIAGDEELDAQARSGELDVHAVTLAAQDNADGRMVAVLDGVRLPPVEIEVHLPGVALLEGANLQVDQHMAAQAAVVEHQVNVVVLSADGDTPLPRLEAEPFAQFEEETLQVVEQRPDRIRDTPAARRARRTPAHTGHG